MISSIIKKYLKKNKKSIDTVTVIWYYTCIEIPLGVKISAHGLRHSHATMLIRNLVPIQLVQKRLGHADPALTIATYTHLISEDEKIIIDILEKIW